MDDLELLANEDPSVCWLLIFTVLPTASKISGSFSAIDSKLGQLGIY